MLFPSFSDEGNAQSRGIYWNMAEQEHIEKLYLYCMGELRLLIENPYEHIALIERLTVLKNTVEHLYEKTVLKEK